MCTIVGQVKLTVELDGAGKFPCPLYETTFSCSSKEGEHKVYYTEGSFFVCEPGDPWCSDDPGTDPPKPGEYEKVFCDPCKNYCNIDGTPAKYNGSREWLFTTYVNGAPTPTAIHVATFNVSYDGSGNQKKLTVNDKTCCCNHDKQENLDPIEKSIDLEQAIESTQQTFIKTSDDPKSVCKCNVLTDGPKVVGCGGLANAISTMRRFERRNCTFS